MAIKFILLGFDTKEKRSVEISRDLTDRFKHTTLFKEPRALRIFNLNYSDLYFDTEFSNLM